MPNQPKKILIKVKKKAPNELTREYSTGKEAMENHLNKTPGDVKDDKVQGILIKKEGMTATPKQFVRKVVSSTGAGGTTKIIGDDGKTVIYQGRTTDKATEDALNASKKHVDRTNEKRNYNANFYNVNSGAKKTKSEEDKEILARLNKIK